MPEDNLPDPSHAPVVSRTTAPPAHDWHANEDDASHHHGLVSANEFRTQSHFIGNRVARVRQVHVGNDRINLRALAKAGFAEAQPGNKVRLRFARDADGRVVIQVNNSSPALPVGHAQF